MGCFLACFGFGKSSKKRRRSCRRTEGHGRYVPLDSDVFAEPGSTENHVAPDSDDQLKENTKGLSASKIKKRVRFNLDVKAYEPIPNEDDIGLYQSDTEEETKWVFNAETEDTASLQHGEDSLASSIRSQAQPSPANRYQNCVDNYEDEDEELKFDENDWNLDGIEASDDEAYDVYTKEAENGILSQDDFLCELSPVAIESADEVTTDQVNDEDSVRSPELLISKGRVRDRGEYVFNVLNPVENLMQWKAVKGKAATPQLRSQKENSALHHGGLHLSPMDSASDDPLSFKKVGNPAVAKRPADHPIAVDASLSNWLGSMETQNNHQG